MKPFLPHDTNNWFCFLENLGVAADHKYQLPLLGSPGTSRHRRVQKIHLTFLAGGSDLSSKCGRYGAGIDVDASRTKRAKCSGAFAWPAPEDLLERRGIADNRDKDIGCGRDILGRATKPGASCNKRLGARGCAVPDG